MMKTYSFLKQVGYLILANLGLCLTGAQAQMRVGQPAGSPDPSGALDINGGPYSTGSPYRGIVPPKVALTNTSLSLPVSKPTAGLLIYNTATQSDVSPGYYYWEGSKWLRLSTSAGGSARIASGAGQPLLGYTMSDVRSLTATPDNFILVDPQQEGLFRYDATDHTTADNTGTVLVSTGSGRRYKRVVDGSLKVRWFGALPDDTSNDQPAIQAAINEYMATGHPVEIDLRGTYLINSTLTKVESFTGLEMHATAGQVTFDYAMISGSSPCLKIIGGSGKVCKNYISGIAFKGNSNTTAIEIAGQCGQHIKQCTFMNNATGVRFHNEALKSFSEWNNISDCSFDSACSRAVHYKRSSGNDSFHGSGLIGSNYIVAAGSEVILIDDGCLPYNCPLHTQVWFRNTMSFIKNLNTGTAVPYFNGHITFERFSGAITLATNHSVFFTGGIQAFGDYVDSGLLYQCEGVVANKNSSFVPYGVRYNVAAKISSTDSTVTLTASPVFGTYLTQIVVVGPNYDYRALLQIDPSGGGNLSGFVNTIDSSRSFNGNGCGKPHFSIVNGQLRISNSCFVGKGDFDVFATYRQTGDFIYGNYPAKTF